MSFSPHEIGTLIVVVLKARNLPNKRHIGKQAPYCLLSLNEESWRTKVIKRGGQHPEWDEEFRFTILEDVEVDLVRAAPGSDTPPPLPPKKKGPKKIKGGNFMKLQCYADDPRDPDFIGEAFVDLTEALTKGETDEWFTLMNKDKYAGEVYLELTFWSNEPPPEKKIPRKPTIANKSYGGPGSFVPADALSNGNPRPPTLPASGSTASQLDSLPSSLRASGSRPELYAPPYEHRNLASPVEHMVDDFAELGVVDQRSRDSYATLRPSISAGLHQLSLPSSHSYEQQQSRADGSNFAYDNMATSKTPQHRLSFSASYYPTYENGSVSSHPPPVRNHGPRYSVPTSSSGFIPVTNVSASSSYTPASYSPEPTTFSVQHASHSPSPNPPPHSGYSPHHAHPGYQAIPSVPVSFAAQPLPPPLPPQSAASHRVSHSFTTSPIPEYHSYQPPHLGHEQAVSFPTQPAEYGGPFPPPTPAHSAPPQMYPAHTQGTPSPPAANPPLPAALSSSTGSRPLPQPGQPQRDRRYSVAIPPSSSFPQHASAGLAGRGSHPPAPPIPPQYRRIPSAPGHAVLTDSRLPPLPVPPSQVRTPSRSSILPQLAHGYHSTYQAPPLPDPPQHGQQVVLSNSSSVGNAPHFQDIVQRPPLRYPSYGQPLPTPPALGDWQRNIL